VKGLKAVVWLAALAAVVASGFLLWIASRGISARAEPGRLETAIARTMRSLAIPRSERTRANPIAPSADVLESGMGHYADHCASCHANDGSGDTALGRGLYPKPPDMRLEPTQSLTDGELFYIIENGVRLTGMPAFSTGAPEGEESTWHLVAFIRRLPSLTPDEIERMDAMNPVSPAQWQQRLEDERFLRGENPAPPASHGH
jgi:mono/diheme cytochrome c family protein